MRAPIRSDERDRLRRLRELELLHAGRSRPRRHRRADRRGLRHAARGVRCIDGDQHTAGPGTASTSTAERATTALRAHDRGHGLLVVPDARADARFADHPDVDAGARRSGSTPVHRC
jgi:hypothetical protein